MKYRYWLSNIKGLSNLKLKMIYDNNIRPEEIYDNPKIIMSKIYGCVEKDIWCIEESKRKWNLDMEWEKFLEKSINFVSIDMPDYPQKLKNIHNAPYSLYYIGKLPNQNRKAVAIVGARGRSGYGSEVARKISGELAKYNIDVISGMAKGIDADGHIGALDVRGDTYAVLGCGVDVCYPASNRYIYNRIIDCGGVISEYAPGTKPAQYFFPARNRIISGLSDYIVVIEAREKSGSLITADYAMEQGKDVYAVPGRITDSLSGGCNSLIKQGAGVINNIDEFIKDILSADDFHCSQIDFRKNILEKDELLVYSLLDFRAIGLSELMEKLPMELYEIINIMESLCNKGFAREISPNFYIKTL